MSHTQFTRDARIELATLLWAKKSKKECALRLRMHPSNIGREIELNKDPDGIYRGVSAHKKYLERRKKAKLKERKIENDTELRKYIVSKLKALWSPEQIAGRLKKLRGSSIICHETIYTFIYTQRKDLIKYLRHQKSKYRKRRGSRARITQYNVERAVCMLNDRPRKRLGYRTPREEFRNCDSG